MSEPSSSSRRPRVFRLDETVQGPRPFVEESPDPFTPEEIAGLDPPADEEAIQNAQKQGIFRRTFLTWGGVFWSALGTLVMLALGIWFTKFIEDLFARVPVLGYTALALAGLAILALVVLAAREIAGIARQRHIARMHIDIAAAREKDDRDAARKLLRELTGFYGNRADTARARKHIEDLTSEIVDGRDLIDIAERELVGPMDRQITKEIAKAARRVSVVTAISPRAIVDLLFVMAQTLRLIRMIAQIYGGRPGTLGFLKLLRSVLAHLAVTGGMAATDSLIQQVLGHGIAARLSARLGEGVLNGLLTTRVGLSAMSVCRPMPFAVEDPPGVRDVAPFLFSSGKDEK